MKKALANKVDSTVATSIIVGGILLATFGFANAATTAPAVDSLTPTTSVSSVAKHIGSVGNESLGMVANAGGGFSK